MISISSRPQPRFGWRATPDEIKLIQETAKTHWKAVKVDKSLCYSQSEADGLWNKFMRFIGKHWDNLTLRWQMFRKGYGMFAKCVPDQLDVYRLHRYATPEKAREALERFTTTETQLKNLKRNLLAKAGDYREYMKTAWEAFGKVDTLGLGVPEKWLNPFPTMAPFRAPGGKTGGKQNWVQEHYISSTQVVPVDDKTLLVRVRLGPHA